MRLAHANLVANVGNSRFVALERRLRCRRSRVCLGRHSDCALGRACTTQRKLVGIAQNAAGQNTRACIAARTRLAQRLVREAELVVDEQRLAVAPLGHVRREHANGGEADCNQDDGADLAARGHVVHGNCDDDRNRVRYRRRGILAQPYPDDFATENGATCQRASRVRVLHIFRKCATDRQTRLRPRPPPHTHTNTRARTHTRTRQRTRIGTHDRQQITNAHAPRIMSEPS